MPGERRYTSLNTPFIGSLMSEARRLHVHGRLLPMDRPLKDEGSGFDDLDIWDEQPPFWLGLLILLAGLLSIVVTILLVKAVLSFEPPTASDANAPASSLHASSGVEAVAAGGKPAR